MGVQKTLSETFSTALCIEGLSEEGKRRKKLIEIFLNSSRYENLTKKFFEEQIIKFNDSDTKVHTVNS